MVCLVEVGYRGFVGKTTTRLLKDLGITGQAQRQDIKALSCTAEQASRWLVAYSLLRNPWCIVRNPLALCCRDQSPCVKIF